MNLNELQHPPLDRISAEAVAKFKQPVRNISSSGRLSLGGGSLDTALSTDEVFQVVSIGASIEELADAEKLFPLFVTNYARMYDERMKNPPDFEPFAAVTWAHIGRSLAVDRLLEMGCDSDTVNLAFENIFDSIASFDIGTWLSNGRPLDDSDFVEERGKFKSELSEIEFSVASYCPAPQIGRSWHNTAVSVFRRAYAEGLFQK